MSYKEILNDAIDKSIPTSNTGTWRDTPKRPRTNRLLKDVRDNLGYFEQETIKQRDTTEYTRELLTKADAEEVRYLLELGSAALASLAQSRGTDIDSVISQKVITEELETLEALIEFNTYFKGKFTSESNLIAATPTMDPVPKYGDFVIVDPGEGIDATFYAWDNDDSKWIEGGHVIDLSVFVTKTQIDTDETLSDDSDALIPSQKAVKAYVDSNAADKTLPINWIEVSTSTFLIEPEHAGKTLWVTADCVITVSAYSTLPTGFNCEILKADSDLIVSIEASGSDTIREGKSVIISDASVFKSISAGVIGLVGDVQGVNDTDDAPSDGKTYGRKDGAWVDVQDISNIQPSITGSCTTNGTTDNTLVLTGIVSALALEAGDVIQITGSTDGLNDKLFTVESITNDNTIRVNFEHAGNRGDGSLRLVDETTTVTITRIAKWYNASIGVGQAWVDVTASRSANTTYTNNTGRPIMVSFSAQPSSYGTYDTTVDGVVIAITRHEVSLNTASVSFIIPAGSEYRTAFGVTLETWTELR